eukprot:PhM_4_TR16781/c0_g2_i3/m.103537
MKHKPAHQPGREDREKRQEANAAEDNHISTQEEKKEQSRRKRGKKKYALGDKLAEAAATLTELVQQNKTRRGSLAPSFASSHSMRSNRSIKAYSVTSSAGHRGRRSNMQQWSVALSQKFGVDGEGITEE